MAQALAVQRSGGYAGSRFQTIACAAGAPTLFCHLCTGAQVARLPYTGRHLGVEEFVFDYSLFGYYVDCVNCNAVYTA